MTAIVPPETYTAARRGLIRTTAQAYAATLTTATPTAAVILSIIDDPSAWIPAAVTVGLALVTPWLAGLASYLSILSSGIPEAYTTAGMVESGELPSSADL